MKIGAAVAVAALVCAGALATVQSAAFARSAQALSRSSRALSSSSKSAGLSVSGKVNCPPGQPVDGVWVNSSGGGSSYARWRAASRSSASYRTWLQTSTPTAISLHIGCGGSTVDWQSADWTPAVLMVTRSETINAECLGGQCIFPSAERAAAWAERHLTAAGGGNRALRTDRVADRRAYASWAGLDLAFVVSAYLNGAGALPRPAVTGSANANSMYQAYAGDHLVQRAWVTSSGVSQDPPAGAMVFYSGSASGGRIAISTGAGGVVSVNSSGTPLVRQQSYASIPGYLGWALPANMVDGLPVSPLESTAPSLPPLHPIAGAGHPVKSAANPRPSAPGPASSANRWISRALTGCLVLLAMFALVFAGRALLAVRRRYGRHRHKDAASLAVGTDWHNPGSVRGQAADAPLATRAMVTASSSPLRMLPPAPGPPLHGSPAPLPGTPPATSGEAADPVSAAELEAQYVAELVTVGGSSGPASEGTGGRLPLAPPLPERGDDGWPGATERPAFSSAALRLLGLREHSAGERVGEAQRHEVVFEDCRVETVLAEAPANNRTGKSPEGRGWVASAPYLVWTPLPHDVPGGGTAFACVGVGTAGCLFIDLAAAPGVLTLRGEPQVAGRLAESLVHQLCAGPAADRVRLVVVADALAQPAPSRAEWVVSVGELGERPAPRTARKAELVFCRASSDADVFGLARYVASSPYRVVPVILADLPGAPWSFTAHRLRE